jgi:hypothetical protein
MNHQTVRLSESPAEERKFLLTSFYGLFRLIKRRLTMRTNIWFYPVFMNIDENGEIR